MVTRTSIYDLNREALNRLFSDWGYSEYYTDQVWGSLYRKLASTVDEIKALRPGLARRLKAETFLQSMTLVTSLTSRDDQTTKYLLSSQDGQDIETVVMDYRNRKTACISTQVGCAMGCVFCATGQMGFVRHLSAGEIVEQVLFVKRQLVKQRLSLRNIVFMGMGEPLHNYESTMTAIEILTDDKGLAIAPRHITLSTIGIPGEIRRLADENRQINLAVSLHAASDDKRSDLVPVNRRWSLAELLEACRYYSDKSVRRILFEWALIEGENDAPAEAHAIGKLLAGMRAHVNLIPLNLTEGYDGKPTSLAAARRFQSILREYQVPSTIRQRKGIDIGAGCGQLRRRVMKDLA